MSETLHTAPMRLITQKRVTLTINELLFLIREPVFYLILLVPFSINYIYHDATLIVTGRFILPILIWLLVVSVAAATYMSCIFYLCFTGMPLKKNSIFEPFVAFGTSTVAILFASPVFVQAGMSLPQSIPEICMSIGICFISIEICILIYMYWLRDFHLAKYASSENFLHQPIEVQIIIGGKRFNAAHLRYVKSENQYIHVFTDFEDQLVLGSLKGIEHQLNSGEGFLVHRSYFVMRRDVDKIVNEGDTTVLRLKDRTAIPLSRQRIAEVRAWLSR